MGGRLLISEAFRLYRSDYIAMKNQALKTEEAYINAGKLLLKFMGDTDICQLTFEDVRDWRNWMLSWQAPDTVRGNTICLRNVLKFLMKKKYDVLDYDEIAVPKRVKRVIKYLTEDEMQRFITETGRRRRGYSEINRIRNVAIVKLLYATGLRNEELCGLDRNTIKNRTFTVVGKSKDPRIGFIDTDTEKAIASYLEIRADNNKALFISPQTGQRITPRTLRLIFHNICNRSEEFEGVHPHTIRHSYGTKMLRRKVDLRYIGDLLGHVSLDTTKMYTHYENPQLKEIYDLAHFIA